MRQEKLWIILLIVCLTLTNITTSAGEKKDDKKNKNKGPKAIQCEHDLLTSYLLHGRHKSKPDVMHLCPTIKNNCCTKMDQQRIYHIVKEFLPQRLLEYQSKIRMALAKLRELHIKINHARPVFSGAPKRRLYCNAQGSKMYNFPFFKMYNEIMEYLDIVRDELEDYYNTFFCSLCDADQHKYFNLKTRKLAMDSEFCKEMLDNHQEPLKIFNVDLIQYLQALQNVVDCTHYVRSYNLEFFDKSKNKVSKSVVKCISNLGSKDFMKSCKDVCETLKLSKVIDTIEGDFEFIIDAVNLFEKFFEFKESGSFISMKLRAFFKRFVVPRNQSRKGVNRFLHDVESQNNTKKARKALVRNKRLAAKAGAEGVPTVAAPRNLMDDMRAGSNLMGMIPELPDDHELALAAGIKPDDIEGIDPRILNAVGGRSDSQAPDNAGTSVEEVKGNNEKKNGPPQKKKVAKLVFNKELFNFYNELHIKKPEQEEAKVFRLRAMPTDIDELKKVFATETGLNPMKFIGNTNFSMDQATLYRLLFNHVDNDKPDVELMMFLNDFNQKYKDEIFSDVDTHYQIKQKKKQKMEFRVLAEKYEDLE